MSIKIYDGYKLSAMPFDLLNKRLMMFADQARGIIDEYGKKRVAKEAVRYYDSFYLAKGKSIKNGAITESHLHFLEKVRINKMGITYDPSYDFSCEICVIPCGESFLAILYCVVEDVKKVWKTYSWVRQYEYYTNTDKPDNLAETEWEARGDEWEKALSPSWIPGLAGFKKTITPVDEVPMCQLDEAFARIPSTKERAMMIADIRYAQELLNINGKMSIHEYISYREKNLESIVEESRAIELSLPEINKDSLGKSLSRIEETENSK